MIKKKHTKICINNVYNVHVKKKLKKFLNSIKLFLLFSTEINNVYMLKKIKKVFKFNQIIFIIH
jgi:hypothetical protein